MAADPLFERVLCGIDGSPESAEAARQVARLAPPGTPFLLVGVTQPYTGVPGGWTAVAVAVLETKRELEDALERARADVGRLQPTGTLLVQGAPIPTLLATVEREGATLIAVGIQGRSRAVGIAIGSVATAMLHDARSSVYVARAAPPGRVRTITVGVDGSAVSAAALAAARELAARLDAELAAIVGLGGKAVDLEAARGLLAGAAVVEDDRDPVEALVAAGADLLVVGSRGLHGLRSLGSVSERVAHRARCPVLVVREPPDRR